MIVTIFDNDSNCFFSFIFFFSFLFFFFNDTATTEIYTFSLHDALPISIASVLDESMGTAAWINGFKVMTATLKVNYYSSVKLDEQLFVETWVDHVEGKKVWMKGKLISENETKLYSESTGLFIILNNEKIKSLETNIKKHTIDDIFK